MVEDLLEDIRALLEQQLEKLDRLTGKKAGGGGSKSSKDDEGLGAGQVFGILKGFVGMVVKATLALTAFAALPPLMTAAVAPFVEALNPGLLEQFNVVLRNLQATIGYAFEPIIAQAVATLRTWSGMLMPLMRELRPVMADLAHTVGEVLIAALGVLINWVRAVMFTVKPFVGIVTGTIRIMAQLMDVVTLVHGVLMETVASFFGVDEATKTLSNVFDWFRNMLFKCVSAVALVTTGLLKMVGATEMIAKMRAAVERRIAEKTGVAGGLVAAPRDVSTGGPEDIARRMAERAFAAVAGAGAAKTDVDLLTGILDAIKEGEAVDWKAVIRDGVKAGIEAAGRLVPGFETARRIAGPIADVSTRAAEFVLDPLAAVRSVF